MADASSIAISPKAPPEERRFFSKLGSQIQTAFKKLGSGIELKREIADAEKNRPELQGYRNSISAEQAARRAEWAQRKQSFMESFPAKIPGLAAAVGASIGLYVMGLSPVIYIGVLIGIILILLFIPGRRVLQFIIVLAILFVIFYFVPIFWPLAQSYAQENKGAPALKGGVASITEFTQSMRKQLSNYVDTQIQCASGNCPRGQAEGEYVGIQISDPQLMLPDKEYKPGEQVTVSADVSGVNLKIYSSIKATTNCSIIGNDAKSVSPKTIPFADISNNKRTITCILKTVNTNSGINTIKTSISFPFNTTSDLPVYMMDEERRNIMMEMWGRDFLSTHYKIDPDPIATFNDGPMNIGIKVNQVPIAAQGSGSDEAPAELVFALFNQWGYYNGEVVSLENIVITLPSNIEIYKISDDDACPFTGSGGKYTLSKTDLGNYTIKTVRTFVCGLNVKKMSQQSFDLFTGHIKITAQYTYRMTSQMDLTLKTSSSSSSSGSGAALEALSEDCSDADASNLPPETYRTAYKSGKFSTEIKNGISEGLSQYQPDWLTPDSMRNVLLALMYHETSMGSAGDDDGDGIPDHIAGCTSKDNPRYIKNSVSGDIICAAERINTYTKIDTTVFCKRDSHSTPESLLTCAFSFYGPAGAEGEDGTDYANKLESYMKQWHNYFCSTLQ